MKSYRVFMLMLLFVIILLILCGCTTSKETANEKNELTGMLKVIGNEPFTKLALQTLAGKTYILQCPLTIQSALLKHQGYRTTVRYDSLKQTFEGQALHIIDADTAFTAH
jgi:predicted component of type VI protein secretion system